MSIPATTALYNQPLLSRKINKLVRENVKLRITNYSLGSFPIHFVFSSLRQGFSILVWPNQSQLSGIGKWQEDIQLSSSSCLDYQCQQTLHLYFCVNTVRFKIGLLSGQAIFFMSLQPVKLHISFKWSLSCITSESTDSVYLGLIRLQVTAQYKQSKVVGL